MAGPVQDLPEEKDTNEVAKKETSKKNRLPKQNPNWFNTTLTGSLDPSDPVSVDSDINYNTAPPNTLPPQENMIREVKEQFRQSMFDTAQAVAQNTQIEDKILTSKDLLHSRWDNMTEFERNSILTTLQASMTEEQKNLQQKMLEFEFHKKQKTFEFNIFAKKVGFTAAIFFLIVFLGLFGWVAITQGTLGENADIAAIVSAMFHGIKIFIGM